MSNLEAQEAVGTALQIYCQNHTDRKGFVNSKEDFAGAPQGGCSQQCGYRLICGHVCESACHVIDKEHVDQYNICNKTCGQIVAGCELRHLCCRTCHHGEVCGRCTTEVEKIRPECQHKLKTECSVDPSLVQCDMPCEKKLECGHICKELCSVICGSLPCYEEVQVLSPCGHRVTVKCSARKNILTLFDACTEPCDIELKCGHVCKGSCGKCKFGRLHTR